MEGRKQMGSSSSSSSFTSELFGPKESSGSSSAEIFGSIFAPSSKVAGRESVRSEVGEKKLDSASQAWSTKPGVSESKPWSSEGKNQSTPCHLSSSIYYGGQDIYSQPQAESTQNSGYSTVNKDGEEDDSGSASRGNWWQGSLYY